MKNTPSTQSTVAPAPDSEPMLDAERLDVDVLRSSPFASSAERRHGRSLLVRMVQMLTRLDQSLQ
jgi:hypothetical protein